MVIRTAPAERNPLTAHLAEPITPIPDLAECALEPIQIIGHIQPHGLLFALSEPDLIIHQVSINVSTLLEMSPETLLGCSIESVLGARQFETFRSQILNNEPFSAKLLRIPAIGGAIEVSCIAHRRDGVLPLLGSAVRACGIGVTSPRTVIQQSEFPERCPLRPRSS
jgi:hypothetical protein